MKYFIIIGEPGDLHANYVAWAMEQAGYETRFINSSHENSPTRTSLYLDHEVDEFGVSDWTAAEAVWCRRLPKPPGLNRSLGEDDGFILVEERRFTRWLIGLLENHPIRWINPPPVSLAAENKLLQLKRARAHGLAIPRTLVTAQPERFKAFLRREGSLVAKPLCGYSWDYASGETLTAFANLIDAKSAATLSDADIGQCVTIYQELIAKVADIRMLILGQDIFAYKISQDGKEQHLDFRIGFFEEDHLRYEPIDLPSPLKTKLNAFIASLGIDLASADFALTADGEFVFLDLNPNGQWLFLEAGWPASRAGAKFCSFFVKGYFDSSLEARFPSYAQYLESDHLKATEAMLREHAEGEARPTNLWREKQA